MEQLILDRAAELFTSIGLKNVSMDDIARKAGMSKKTIYQFYSDKKELVGRIIGRLVREHSATLERSRATAPDAIQEELMRITTFCDIWSSVNAVFFYDLERSFPSAWQQLQDHKQTIHLSILNNLEWGIETGVYRENEIRFTAAVRLQHFDTTLQPRSLQLGGVTSRDLLAKLTSLYLHGIVTNNGKKLLIKYISE